MKKLFIYFVSLALSACVTSKEMYLPDGSVGHNVTCGGQIYSMGDCVQKAGEICGEAGYDLLGKNGEVIPYSVATGSIEASRMGDTAMASGYYQSQSGAFINREIFIRCKK